jgi:hypothetical protein
MVTLSNLRILACRHPATHITTIQDTIPLLHPLKLRLAEMYPLTSTFLLTPQGQVHPALAINMRSKPLRLLPHNLRSNNYLTLKL